MPRCVLSLMLMTNAVPCGAQARDVAQDREAAGGSNADVGSGIVGQRQTREDSGVNIAPMGRIESRITNRVQSRIRNRIDRYYDPSANAASPFEVAGDQVRKSPRGR